MRRLLVFKNYVSAAAFLFGGFPRIKKRQDRGRGEGRERREGVRGVGNYMGRVWRFGFGVMMGLSFLLVVFLPGVNLASPLPAVVGVVKQVDFSPHFRDLGVEGSIAIYDLNLGGLYQHNPARNNQSLSPASTFKILNSLIALEANVIPNELSILTWDGVPRLLPEWNRDLNMREAIKVSAVWFYQVLARRVGFERMQQAIAKVGYGNNKIGTKAQIDRFWLDTELQITPNQQIQFLRRLYQDDLPFSKRTLSIVKDIMVIEKTPDYQLSGKTGLLDSTFKSTPSIGWYVGYLEKGKNVYFFATNIDIRNKKDPAARKEVTRRCFKTLGLL